SRRGRLYPADGSRACPGKKVAYKVRCSAEMQSAMTSGTTGSDEGRKTIGHTITLLASNSSSLDNEFRGMRTEPSTHKPVRCRVEASPSQTAGILREK